MDEEKIELVRRLLTEAGMIMEDVSAVAILSPVDIAGLRRAADELNTSVLNSMAYIDAAKALLG